MSNRRYLLFVAIAITVLALIFTALSLKLKYSDGQPPLTLSGTVVDAVSGAPLAGVAVSDEGYGPKPYRGDVTDVEGRFSYQTWGEEHTVVAAAPGYKAERKTLEAAGGEEARLDFRLTALGNGAASSPNAAEETGVGGERVDDSAFIAESNDALPEIEDNDIDGLADKAFGSRRPFNVADRADRSAEFPEEKNAVLEAARGLYALLGSENQRELYESLPPEQTGGMTFEDFSELKMIQAYEFVYRRSKIFHMTPERFREQTAGLSRVRVLDATVQSPELALVQIEMTWPDPETGRQEPHVFWVRWARDEGRWVWVIPGSEDHLRHEQEAAGESGGEGQ